MRQRLLCTPCTASDRTFIGSGRLPTFRGLFRPLFCSLLLVLLTTAVPPAAGQEAHYLALGQEGAASVILDRQARTAFITDGGKRGQGGIAGARIEGRTVLDYLKEHGVRRLVLTCSHPHRDHAGGLEELVQDSEILSFNEIDFVDNEYAAAPGSRARSLYDLFQQALGEHAGPLRVRYFSARNQDAFRDIAASAQSVRPGNYVYDPDALPRDPDALPRDPHDQTVITHYDVFDGQRQTRVVDFDDASSRLIRHWAESQLPQIANVLIVPHHGSRRNDLSPVLDNVARHGLENVVLSVNRANRYSHPAPVVLRTLVERLGPEHVYVTDSEIGDNITISPDGVSYANDSRQPKERLARFVRAQIHRYEADYRSLLQNASTSPASRLAVTNGTPEEIADGLLNSRLFDSTRDAEKFKRLIRGLLDLGSTLDLVEGTNDQQRRHLLLQAARALVPLTLGSLPDAIPSDTARSGIARWLNMIDRSAVTGSSHRDARAARFRSLAQSPIPRWGGVVLGNAVNYRGSRPQSVNFVDAPSLFEDLPSGGMITLRVVFEDGSTVEYADFTPDELWSAYNFVQPIDALHEAYGDDLPRGSAGLIGISERAPGGEAWSFAVHPAIAGSVLARDAMRLDMLIAGAERANDLPGGLDRVPWGEVDYWTYQWTDAEAEITTSDGRLVVSPVAEPATCMLRVRLVSWDVPDWFDQNDGEVSMVAEVARRLIQRDMEGTEQQVLAVASEIEQELVEAVGNSRFLNQFMSDICREFDAANTIDRLARLISVLNWLVESTGDPLPPLPSSMGRSVPVTPMPSTWAFSRLFATVDIRVSQGER